VVVDNRNRKAGERVGNIPGPAQGGTIENQRPHRTALPPSLLFNGAGGYKPVPVGQDFGALKRPGGTGERLFSQPAQGAAKGKLASHAVSVRLFMAGHKKPLPLVDKIKNTRRNRYRMGHTIFSPSLKVTFFP
jgi:hypothetical protein